MKDDVEELLAQIFLKEDMFPDVVVLNSAMWDLAMYNRVRHSQAVNR